MSEFQGITRQFHKEIQEEIDNLSQVLLYGNLPSFEEYKFVVGKRWGLERALERHKEFISLMENYDEDRTNRS